MIELASHKNIYNDKSNKETGSKSDNFIIFEKEEKMGGWKQECLYLGGKGLGCGGYSSWQNIYIEWPKSSGMFIDCL